jgi:hypothetical protein
VWFFIELDRKKPICDTYERVNHTYTSNVLGMTIVLMLLKNNKKYNIILCILLVFFGKQTTNKIVIYLAFAWAWR